MNSSDCLVLIPELPGSVDMDILRSVLGGTEPGPQVSSAETIERCTTFLCEILLIAICFLQAGGQS